MKYRFDDLDSLNDKEGMFASITETAKAFIAKHPALQARATAVSVARLCARPLNQGELSALAHPELIQDVLETEFLKREKISYLLNTERGLKLQKYVESREDVLPEERGLVCKCWAYMRLHLRVSPSQMIGWLNDKFDSPEELQAFLHKWDGQLWTRAKYGSWFLTRAPITKEESEDLDLFQSSLPMVCPPRKIKWGKPSPYRIRKIDGWTKKASVRHKEMPYEALNIQNRTKYGINYPVWERFKFEISLPEREENENDGHYADRCKSKVREHWRNVFLYEFFWQMGIDSIWVININDHRARNYSSQGGFIKLQGQDLDKSIPTLPPEVLTERGKYWLSISIANCFNVKYEGKDLDKHIFAKRFEWYEQTIQPLMALNREEFNRKIDELLPQAESPCCFWAQVQNMYEAELALREGRTPMVWVITHWDATCSGYQFQSLMTRDIETAKLVNIHQEEERYDLYTERANEFVREGCTLPYNRTKYKKKILLPYMYGGLGWAGDLEGEGEGANAQIIVNCMKRYKSYEAVALMSRLDKYIGDQYSCWLPDGTLIAKRFDHTRSIEVDCLGHVAKVAIKCRGRGINPETGRRKGSKEYLTVAVHSCDGFVLRELLYRSGLRKEDRERIKDALEHPDTETVTPNRDTWEFYRMKCLMKRYRLYSHRFLYILNKRNSWLYSQDDLEVIKSMLGECKETYDISCIHDSFGVIPNHVDDLMENYRQIMACIATSRWLPEVVSQLTKGQASYKYEKCPKELYENILNSKYMLC